MSSNRAYPQSAEEANHELRVALQWALNVLDTLIPLDEVPAGQRADHRQARDKAWGALRGKDWSK